MSKSTEVLQFTRGVQMGKLPPVAKILNNLDRLALGIHRLKWMGRASHCNFATFAVVKIGDDYWYASNALDPVTHEEFDQAYNFLSDSINGSCNSYYVYLKKNEGDDSCTHAEIKLLYQLTIEKKLQENMYMGISKPACEFCYKTLTENKINVSWTHKRQVKNWAYPLAIKDKIPDEIKSFF